VTDYFALTLDPSQHLASKCCSPQPTNQQHKRHTHAHTHTFTQSHIQHSQHSHTHALLFETRDSESILPRTLTHKLTHSNCGIMYCTVAFVGFVICMVLLVGQLNGLIFIPPQTTQRRNDATTQRRNDATTQRLKHAMPSDPMFDPESTMSGPCLFMCLFLTGVHSLFSGMEENNRTQNKENLPRCIPLCEVRISFEVSARPCTHFSQSC